jgi:hypothetical protein
MAVDQGPREHWPGIGGQSHGPVGDGNGGGQNDRAHRNDSGPDDRPRADPKPNTQVTLQLD